MRKKHVRTGSKDPDIVGIIESNSIAFPMYIGTPFEPVPELISYKHLTPMESKSNII
jgi:hypothetical protein